MPFSAGFVPGLAANISPLWQAGIDSYRLKNSSVIRKYSKKIIPSGDMRKGLMGVGGFFVD
jgi:hypothetical protein